MIKRGFQPVGTARFMEDFWVFGYGSLMWNPGFPVLERQRATMYGVHRALCIRSWVHRGTKDNPGLVLGLDRGGCCHGVAFRVTGDEKEETISYLRARELVTRVYLERWRTVRLEESGQVSALVYLVDRRHEQYAGRLPDHEISDIVRRGQGKSGPNTEYVVNTVEHLREVGIRDPHLESIVAHLQRE